MKRALLAAALLGAMFPTPSNAATYYDYWSYWHKPPTGTGAWQYSKVGPSGYYLQPGTQVEGWRYAIGTASPSDPKPRPEDVTYDEYCAGKDTGSTYRVLLVVDYGTQSGAPAGPVYSCYGFDKDHQPSGLTVLTKQHQERDDGGLICAIDNYPKTGCGDVVSSPAPKATKTSTTTVSAAPRPQPVRTSSSAPRTSAAPSTAARASATPRVNRSGTATPTTSAAGSASPSATDSAAVVAKQFVPPHRRGGVPFGFIAACAFVVVLLGAVWLQRRRSAG